MKDKELVRHLSDYFKTNNVPASSTAIDSFLSRNYLNQNLLDTLDTRVIYRNVDKILGEVLQTYRKRTERSLRRTKVRDLDVRPVLKKRFCSMPPFCKDT